MGNDIQKDPGFPRESRRKKVKTHLTWDPNNDPNRLSRFLIRKPNILGQDPTKKPVNFVFLGFLIPFLGMCLVYLIMSICFESQESYFAPGTNRIFSMLYSDCYHQYFPFFKAFRQNILSGRSLLYCWDVGMGLDYIGLYAYYLGSPLNWLSILVPEAWLLDFFTLLTPIRLGLAGMFFALFLQKVFNKNDLSIALFGCFYATSAWAFGYMWNTMWLDTFALLPLVVLGTVRLLNERKFVLYTVSLFLSVLINYYIGFFTCIFTLLVFICYEICRFKGFKRFAADLGLMALFTVIAIGATAMIILPAYSSLLMTNAGDSISFAAQAPALNITGSTAASEATTAATTAATTKFRLNMTDREDAAGFKSFSTWLGLIEGMLKVAGNAFAFSIPNYMHDEGLPNIYCGLFAVLFAFLFLTCKQVKWRDRICALLMLLFINASFVINNLNYIWHGFHNTNMIPYRFSFLYSFVLLYMAYRTWLLRRKFRPWQIFTAAGMSVLLLFLSDGFRQHLEFFKGPISLSKLMNPDLFFPYVNLLLLAGYTAALLISAGNKLPAPDDDRQEKLIWLQKRRFRRSLSAFFLVCILCGELLLNFAFFGITTKIVVDASDYPKGTTDTAKVIEEMEAREDSLFYRAESSHEQIFNDGALNGYHGVTTFTSSANASVTTFMKALGYGAAETWNRYCYEDGSPVSAMFLNLKYMIEWDGIIKENPYFTDVYSSGDVHLLENNLYLPLGFMVDPGMAECSVGSIGNRFKFQNTLLSSAIGRDVAAWNAVPPENLEIVGGDGVEVTDITKTSVGSCNYTNNSKNGNVSFIYSFDQEGLLCAAFNIIYPSDFTGSFNPKLYIYLDNGDGFSEEPIVTDTYSLVYVLSACYVHPGDRIKITVDCYPEVSGKVQICAALMDDAVVRQAHQQLSQSAMTVTKFEDTLIEGTVTCEKAGLLYTSIPQNGDSWQVTVDGKPADVTLICGAMVGVMLEEGTHTVTFRYHNKVFTAGCIISCCCAVLFAGICLFVYLRKKKKAVSTLPETESENTSE